MSSTSVIMAIGVLVGFYCIFNWLCKRDEKKWKRDEDWENLSIEEKKAVLVKRQYDIESGRFTKSDEFMLNKYINEALAAEFPELQNESVQARIEVSKYLKMYEDRHNPPKKKETH